MNQVGELQNCMTLGLSNCLCMFRYNALIVELGDGLRPSGVLGVDTFVINGEVPISQGRASSIPSL